MFPRISTLLSFGRRLRDDVSGAVIIYVGLLLPVLIGGGIMVIDAGRLHNLHTTLQKAADSLAMAGAAELDLRPKAMERAQRAIANLVANEHKYAAGGVATVGISSVRFLKSLPASDLSAIDYNVHQATGDSDARFVEVSVTPQTLNTILPAGFIGGPTTKIASASAIAGFQAALCKTVPMFICNPYEGSGTSLFDAVKSATYRRRQMKLQLQGGNNAQFFPGNYGWLDTPLLGNGATALRDALALGSPSTCFYQSGVSQKTGNIENANDAINVRFDLWAGPFNSQKNNPLYPPDENVRKGYKPGNGANGACSPTEIFEGTPPQNNGKLGQDSAFPYAGGRMGNGQWSVETYFMANYGTSPPNGWNDTNPPSRYDVYKHEIANGLHNQLSQAPYEEYGGAPMCNPNSQPNRRTLNVAIINCTNLNVTGNTGGPLPVLAFGQFFLTEPVPKPPSPDAGTIFAELFGLAQPGTVSNEVAHDIVQLYR